MQPPYPAPPPPSPRLPATLDPLRARASRFTAFGVVLAVLAVLGLALGLAMIAMPNHPDDHGVGVCIATTTVFLFALPSLVLFSLGARDRRRLGQLEMLGALASTNARLGLATLATQFGVASDVALRLVLDAVSLGVLRGRMDMEQGVFVSALVNTEVREWEGRCRQCGATARVTVPPGAQPMCPYCQRAMA